MASTSDKKSPSGSRNPHMVGEKFKVNKKIGEGSFGVIYEGTNVTNQQSVAIKFEPRKSDAPQLRDEFRTYKIMNGSIGIPNVYYFGQEGLHNILVMDLLGPSLEDMFDLCGRKFSAKTVCMVAKQMITRVQTLHEKNMIYRDIKPDNFLIGRIKNGSNNDILTRSLAHPHPSSQIYIVDFGMAKQYRDPKTKVHIPYREKKSLSGTARYMSINTHLGREQSRRDDLEALGHVFMYFIRGSLPWQGLKAATNKQKYEKIGEKKQSTSVRDLNDGYPEEFGQYLAYARSLKFEEVPDYDYLRGLFSRVLKNKELSDDGIYDWMYILDRQQKEKEKAKEEKLRDLANQQRLTPPHNQSTHTNPQLSAGIPKSSSQGFEPSNSASFNPNQANSPMVLGTSVNAIAGSVVLDSSTPLGSTGSPLSESISASRRGHEQLGSNIRSYDSVTPQGIVMNEYSSGSVKRMNNRNSQQTDRNSGHNSGGNIPKMFSQSSERLNNSNWPKTTVPIQQQQPVIQGAPTNKMHVTTMQRDAGEVTHKRKWWKKILCIK